jgi:hypothetical protein
MSNTLLVGLLVVIGVVVAILLLRRKPRTTPRPSSAATAAATQREMMLQIVIPDTGACCAAARRIETHRFHKQQAPALPLADCSMKTGCHCRYQPVPDRRVGERRQQAEKREAIRFEENPRRDGRGRRAGDKLFDHDAD